MGACPDALCLQLGTAAIHILAVHAKDLTQMEISIAIIRDFKNNTYTMWCAQLGSFCTLDDPSMIESEAKWLPRRVAVLVCEMKRICETDTINFIRSRACLSYVQADTADAKQSLLLITCVF